LLLGFLLLVQLVEVVVVEVVVVVVVMVRDFAFWLSANEPNSRTRLWRSGDQK